MQHYPSIICSAMRRIKKCYSWINGWRRWNSYCQPRPTFMRYIGKDADRIGARRQAIQNYERIHVSLERIETHSRYINCPWFTRAARYNVDDRFTEAGSREGNRIPDRRDGINI